MSASPPVTETAPATVTAPPVIGKPAPATPSAPAKPTVKPQIGPASKATAAPSAAPGEWNRGEAKPSPPRIVINGVEGAGKTTLGAFAPSAAVIMVDKEDGYETLLESGRVPALPRVRVNTWETLLATINDLAKNPNGVETLVIDALNGCERLCRDMVVREHFSGNESEFEDYGRGYAVCQRDWMHFIKALENCKNAGIAVIILSHIIVRNYKNPEGPAFDRYQTDCNAKIWGLTHKYADAVLFLNFRQALVKDAGAKTKRADLHSGRTRVLYTERSDAYDAKNRFGMPVMIELPDDHTQGWAELAKHIPYYQTESE